MGRPTSFAVWWRFSQRVTRTVLALVALACALSSAACDAGGGNCRNIEGEWGMADCNGLRYCELEQTGCDVVVDCGAPVGTFEGKLDGDTLTLDHGKQHCSGTLTAEKGVPFAVSGECMMEGGSSTCPFAMGCEGGDCAPPPAPDAGPPPPNACPDALFPDYCADTDEVRPGCYEAGTACESVTRCNDTVYSCPDADMVPDCAEERCVRRDSCEGMTGDSCTACAEAKCGSLVSSWRAVNECARAEALRTCAETYCACTPDELAGECEEE